MGLRVSTIKKYLTNRGFTIYDYKPLKIKEEAVAISFTQYGERVTKIIATDLSSKNNVVVS